MNTGGAPMNNDPAMGGGANMQQGGMGGMGQGTHQGHHDHHRRHEAEAAGVGILGGAGVAEHEHHKHKEQAANAQATAQRVDTPEETTGDKIKKHLPGTEAHKVHKNNEQQGGAGMGGGMGGANQY